MTHALEINDAGLILVRDGQVVAEEPGCAMLDGREPQTGVAASRRAKLQPLYAETRFWQELGTAALTRPMPAAATYADVAHAQLAQLARVAGAAGSETLYAVPAWYTREQLAVLGQWSIVYRPKEQVSMSNNIILAHWRDRQSRQDFHQSHSC